MMGVPMSEPNVPPLEIVKVPPFISSRVNFPSLPLFANYASCYIESNLQFRSHGV